MLPLRVDEGDASLLFVLAEDRRRFDAGVDLLRRRMSKRVDLIAQRSNDEVERLPLDCHASILKLFAAWPNLGLIAAQDCCRRVPECSYRRGSDVRRCGWVPHSSCFLCASGRGLGPGPAHTR